MEMSLVVREVLFSVLKRYFNESITEGVMEEVEYQISRLPTPELYVSHRGGKEENDTLFFKQMPIGYYDEDTDMLLIYEQWINVMSNAKFRFVRVKSE